MWSSASTVSVPAHRLSAVDAFEDLPSLPEVLTVSVYVLTHLEASALIHASVQTV